MSVMKPTWSDEKYRIALYHADCRDVLPGLGTPFDLVLTDPPYKMGNVCGGGFAAHRKFYIEGALNDMVDFDLSEYADVLLAAAPMLIAFHSRDLIVDYANLARDSDRKYDLHVWHKTNAIPFTSNTWKSDIEYLSLLWSKRPGWKQVEQARHSKVWISPLNRDDAHPTAKPIPLLAKYIEILEAQSVCDPFMGSGTTGAPCVNLGRAFVGIEKEHEHFDTAVDRIRKAIIDAQDGPLFAEHTPAQQELAL